MYIRLQLMLCSKISVMYRHLPAQLSSYQLLSSFNTLIDVDMPILQSTEVVSQPDNAESLSIFPAIFEYSSKLGVRSTSV